MTSFALIIKEREQIDIYLKFVLIKVYIVWRYGVRKINKIISLKHSFSVQNWSPTVMSIASWVDNPLESIAEASIICVLNIYNGLFRFVTRRKLAVIPTRQWDVPHSAEYELMNARKHKSGLFADKGGVQFLDLLKELTNGFGGRSTITTFSRFTPEKPCGRAGNVEFEELGFLVSRICGLVPYLNRQPHL